MSGPGRTRLRLPSHCCARLAQDPAPGEELSLTREQLHATRSADAASPDTQFWHRLKVQRQSLPHHTLPRNDSFLGDWKPTSRHIVQACPSAAQGSSNLQSASSSHEVCSVGSTTAVLAVVALLPAPRRLVRKSRRHLLHKHAHAGQHQAPILHCSSSEKERLSPTSKVHAMTGNLPQTAKSVWRAIRDPALP